MSCVWNEWTLRVSVIWPIALWLTLVPDGLLLWLLIVCSWSEPGRPVGPAGGGTNAQPAQGWGPGVCVPQQREREWKLESAGTWEHSLQTCFIIFPLLFPDCGYHILNSGVGWDSAVVLFNRSCLYAVCVSVIATRATSWLSHLGERLLSAVVAN